MRCPLCSARLCARRQLPGNNARSYNAIDMSCGWVAAGRTLLHLLLLAATALLLTLLVANYLNTRALQEYEVGSTCSRQAAALIIQ